MTRFVRTAYGTALQNAVELYNQGEYEKPSPIGSRCWPWTARAAWRAWAWARPCMRRADGQRAALFKGLTGQNAVFPGVRERAPGVCAGAFYVAVRGRSACWGCGLVFEPAALVRPWPPVEPAARHLRVMLHPGEGVRELRETGRLALVCSRCGGLLAGAGGDRMVRDRIYLQPKKTRRSSICCSLWWARCSPMGCGCW